MQEKPDSSRALLRDMLIRQVGHQALFRALLASHTDKALLRRNLEIQRLDFDARGLNSAQVPDELREEAIKAIEGWERLLI